MTGQTNVLVTGADGMLGTCICEALLGQGYAVTALVQDINKKTVIASWPLQRVEGDILDLKRLVEIIPGHDYVIHAAASTSVWPAKDPTVKRINVQGTANVAEAALQCRVKRLVHIGSASSFGGGNAAHPANETTAYDRGPCYIEYVQSKRDAQELLLLQYHDRGLPVLILNPTFMIGPYDATPTSGKMLLTLYKDKLPAYTEGGKNFVNAEDVAEVVVHALHAGRLGECYILGGENLSYREFFERACAVRGKPFRLRKAPRLLVLLLGAWQSVWALLTGKKPMLSYAMARLSLQRAWYDASKAVQELGFRQRPIAWGIERCLTWFELQGMLP